MRILFNNGTIIDGSGEESYCGSVVLENGVIADVTSRTIEGFEGEVIDCKESIIAPGFVDVHSHNDWFGDRDDPLPYYQPFVEQGIVTIVNGNCGFSAAGYLPGTDIINCMSGYKKDGRDFSDLEQWFRFMDEQPSNQATMVGHGTLRYSLVKNSTAPLLRDQLDTLKRIASEALEKGALGVSLGLEYAPGMFAPPQELLEIAKIVKKYDRILTLHTRTLGKISGIYPIVKDGRPHNLLALDEAIDLAKMSGCKVHYSHATFAGQGTFDTNEEMLNTIDRAVNESVDVTFDTYSLPSGMSFITYPMPDWYQGLSAADKKKPGNLQKLKEAFALRDEVLKYGFDIIYITNDRVPGCRGKSVKEIAEARDMDPFEAYIWLVDETNGDQRILQKTFVDDNMLSVQMKHPRCLFMTDAWYEPGCIQNYNVYGSFPHFIELSRDGQGTTMADTIRKMSGGAAERFHIPNRGFLKKGAPADICVFNLAKIKSFYDKKPEGMEHVYMNGIPVIKNGETNQKKLLKAGLSIRL